MNSDLNSDCKQCIESKLGWVHSAHTQSPGRAHTACAVPRSWALLRAQLTGRAHVALTASACHALAGVRWSRHAQAAYPRSRPHFDAATSRQPESCRDIKSVPRHCFSCPAPSQVATAELVATLLETPLCRDINFMSRLRFPTGQFATSVPCRDIKSMSRPLTLSPMSRHQIHVATPFLPTVGFPGRDAKIQVATSHTATHVATSKMMSRHQLSSAHFCYVATPFFSMSRPPLLSPMS